MSQYTHSPHMFSKILVWNSRTQRVPWWTHAGYSSQEAIIGLFAYHKYLTHIRSISFYLFFFFFNKKEKLWQYMKPWLLKDTIHQSCRASPPDVPVCATLLETSHRVLPPGPNFAVDLEYLRMLRASHYQSYSVNLAGVGCLHAF